MMMQKKICMLGAFATGKTSMVSRFVKGIFSDRYLTTIGVKIDRKTVRVDTRELLFIVWDIHGEDELQRVRMSYLRGSSGYLLVVDGTRPDTLDKAIELQAKANESTGDVPFLVVLNKSDATAQWSLPADTVQRLTDRGWAVTMTSALTGEGVEEAFTRLARMMLEREKSSGPS